MHPLLQFPALRIAWLVGFFRRHLSAREHVIDFDPNLCVAPDIVGRLERIKINVCFSVIVRMTVKTELIQ